ncbi:MAG: GNAT family N-acetyltransferase [Oscillospiraceae bacterium]
MIRRLEGPADAGRFWALLKAEPFLGGRIATAFQCHQAHPAHCGFFLAGQAGALAVQGDGALLCGHADAEELGLFLAFSGVLRFKSERVRPAGFAPQPQWLMRYAGPTAPLPAPPFGTLRTTPDLWRLAHAGLLAGTDPADFYADACARRNRGLADILAFEVGGQSVATAGVYSLQPGSAYLTAVATHPAHRRRGLAAFLVGTLARRHAASRPVQLLCRPALRPLYEKIGFAAERELCESVRKEGPAAHV